MSEQSDLIDRYEQSLRDRGRHESEVRANTRDAATIPIHQLKTWVKQSEWRAARAKKRRQSR